MPSEHLNSWLHKNNFDSTDATRGAEQQSPLMVASQQADLTIVSLLVKSKVNINQIDVHGNTALWAACYGKNLSIIQLLLDQGADINHQNENGATCLIYAASASRPEVVKALLEARANPQLATHDGYTALDLCTDLACFKLLRHL